MMRYVDGSERIGNLSLEEATAEVERKLGRGWKVVRGTYAGSSVTGSFIEMWEPEGPAPIPQTLRLDVVGYRDAGSPSVLVDLDHQIAVASLYEDYCLGQSSSYYFIQLGDFPELERHPRSGRLFLKKE